MSLAWESTDQFGNLMVASSDTSSELELLEVLKDFCTVVCERNSDPISIAIDVAYSEVSAPRADQVTHVLNLNFISQKKSEGLKVAEIESLFAELIKKVCPAGRDISVRGAWE
jgi:hypothetical protein